MNEGTDDLGEPGRLLTKEGEGYTSGVFVLRQDLEPMEERYMEQDYSKHNKERGDGISSRRTTTVWSKQVEKGQVLRAQ